MSHCQGCPFMGCHDCAFQGGVDPNAPVAQRDSGATRRAKRGSTKYAKGTTESVPAPALTGRGLGRTGLESDAMIVATPPLDGEQNTTAGAPIGGLS